MSREDVSGYYSPPVVAGECDLCDGEYTYREADPMICGDCAERVADEAPEPRGDPDHHEMSKRLRQ